MKYHLIKRNPDINASRGARKVSGKSWLVQTALNRTPAGNRVNLNDYIYNYETGYAVWGVSRVVDVTSVENLPNITDVIAYASERSRLKNEFFWGQLIFNKVWPKMKEGSFKFLSVFEVEIDTKLLDDPFAIPKKYLGQASWRYLEHEIENEKVSIELSTQIPNSLKFKLYNQYNIEGQSHYFDIDHIVPASLGGPGNIEENLMPVAFGINRYKSNRVPLGLFVIAKKLGLINESISSNDQYLSGAVYKDKAKKVVSEVHKSLDSIEEIRDFYSQIRKFHFPNLYVNI